VRVSIIIPTLNEAEQIERSIEHAQRSGADEIVVADGGSDDATVEFARRQNCELVTSATGRAVQQNAGARHATGDVFLFQHADAWLDPAAVDQIKTALEQPTVLGGAFCQQIEAAGTLYRLLEQFNARRVKWLGLPYGDQGIFLRRDVFLELGGFPDVELMEDVLLMRALRRRSRPVLLPGPIHVDARRWQRHGVVRQTIRNWSILTAHACGVSPSRLAQFYQRHDR